MSGPTAAAAPGSPMARWLPNARWRGDESSNAGVDESPLARGLLYAVRCFAAIRLGFIAVAIVTPVAPGADDTYYGAVGALGLAYALVLLTLALWRPRPLLHWHRLGIVDLALVSMLVYTSGGSDSSLVFAYVAIPFLVAFVARPGEATLWSLATITSYVAVSDALSDPEWDQLAPLAFAAICGIAFSAVLVRLHDLVRAHARRARALAAAVFRVEQRERRQLADKLHDGVVQHLADARRELTSAVVDEAAMARAIAALDRGLDQLRGEISGLYPYVLDHVGLAGAVSERARGAAQRGEFEIAVEVDPAAAGCEDMTVMAVLSELLENVVKHADAKHVAVWVSNHGGACLIVGVRDDGRGFHPPSAEEAARARKFGIQSTRDRLGALRGSLDILSAPGAGTEATARIPISRAT